MGIYETRGDHQVGTIDYAGVLRCRKRPYFGDSVASNQQTAGNGRTSGTINQRAATKEQKFHQFKPCSPLPPPAFRAMLRIS